MADIGGFDVGFTLPNTVLDSSPLQQSQQALSQYHQSLTEHLTSQLQSPLQQLSDYHGQISAALMQPVYRVEDALQAKQNKVQQAVTVQLAEHYVPALGSGIEVPTDYQLSQYSSLLPTAPIPTANNNQSQGAVPNRPVPPHLPPHGPGTTPPQQCPPGFPSPGIILADAGYPPGWPAWMTGPQPPPLVLGLPPGGMQLSNCWLIGLGAYTTQQVYCRCSADANGQTWAVWPAGYVPASAIVRTETGWTFGGYVQPDQTGFIHGQGPAEALYNIWAGLNCNPALPPIPPALPPALPPIPPALPPIPPALPPPYVPPMVDYVIVLDCTTHDYEVIRADDVAARDTAAADGFGDPVASFSALNAQDAETLAEGMVAQLFNDNCPAVVPAQTGPPTIDCAAWAGLRQGTEEWFNNIDGIIAAFSQYGLWTLKHVVGIDVDADCSVDAPSPNPDPQNQLLRQLLAQALPGGQLVQAVSGSTDAIQAATTMFGSVIKSTFGSFPLTEQVAAQMGDNLDFGAAIKSLRTYLCQAFQAIVKCGSCNYLALAGLYAVRLVLTLFETFRFDIIVGVNFIGTAWAKPAFSLALKAVQVQRLIDALIEYVCPSKLPDLNQAIEIGKYNLVSQHHYEHLAKYNGVDTNWADAYLYAKREHPDAHEKLEYIKRHPELGLDADLTLRNLGFVDDAERQQVLDLYNKFPDVQELLHFLQRNVFNSQYVQDFSLLSGFSDDNTNTQVIQSIGQLGGNQTGRPLFYDTFKKYLDVAGVDQTLAALHYAAHWLAVPREIGAEMVQRLRPGRVDPSLEFTEAQYRQTLVEQDVPPWALDRYIYLTYSKINQRFLQRMLEFGTINQVQLVDYLQDNGFRQTDAALIADMMRKVVKLQRTTQYHGWDVAKIVEVYKSGLATFNGALQKIIDLGFSNAEANECLAVANGEILGKLFEAKIKAIEKSFKAGTISDAQAIQALIDLLVEAPRANVLVDTWRYERQTDQHLMTAHELVDAVKRGLLNINGLATRLIRMDYDAESVAYMVASAIQDVIKIQQHTFAQQQRQQQALAKAIQQQIERQQKLAKHNAQIQLNLSKAQRKASYLVLKEQIKDAERLLKQQEKQAVEQEKQAIKDAIANASDQDRQALLDQLDNAKDVYDQAVAQRKGKLATDLATTTDKLVKAQLHAQALIDLANLRATYLDAVLTARDAFASATTSVKATNASTEASSLEGLASSLGANLGQQEASLSTRQVQDLLADANQTARVEAMPPP